MWLLRVRFVLFLILFLNVFHVFNPTQYPFVTGADLAGTFFFAQDNFFRISFIFFNFI